MNTNYKRCILTLTCISFGLLGLGRAAAAEEKYPSKPITIMVGYAAGGSADTVARVIGHQLSAQLGKPVIIENRPGASSNIAASSTVRSAPDGYTLFLGSNANAISYTLYKKLSYDLKADLTPIVYVTSFANILVSRNGFPARDVGELIAYAKKHPQKVNYASSGSGSSTHLSAALFESMTGTQLTHIPYKGSAPALTDLIAENVDIMFDNAPSVLPYLKTGKVRAIAVTSPQRLSYLPDVPTAAESGVTGFEVKSWYGLFAPAGTPAEIINALNAQVSKALQTQEVRARLAEMGAHAEGGTQQKFRQHVESEINKWAAVVKRSGAVVD
jgi:tripartite-type tricarboxylate transporter receptor subunit TctC